MESKDVMNEPGVAIPIKSVDEKWEGIYILGEVGLAVDALVHTSKGAVGRAVWAAGPTRRLNLT